MGAHRVYRERKFAFGNQLLTFRTRASLTQSALAEQIGVHLRSVQNWEAGESYPKAETLQRLIGVLLRHQAFTQGNEREEAHALWSQAAQDGPHPLAAFDEVWFARTLALHTATPVPGDRELEQALGSAPAPTPTPDMPRAIIDWGEAIAISTLYGRESEMATLYQWVMEDRCRVVAIVGLGGMGKSSLAIALAQRALPAFDMVLFRSLQNGPPLAEVLDHTIRAISEQRATPPDLLSDKIALLVQLFRERRCLLILDNFESIMQPGALAGAYRSGYAEYGTLLHALSEREHHGCLLLTSREKPAELGPHEGRTAPVRTLQLSGLDDRTSRILLEAKDIVATAADVSALARLYGGNPLALQLVAEPIRELFGSDVGAFLATGDAFFNGVGQLLEQQFARATPLEQTILYWLAVERELVPLAGLLANLGEAVPQREVLAALESLRRRMLIERGPDQPTFTLQPVILEFLTDQLGEAVDQEIIDGRPHLLQRHALVQATAREHVRLSQERLIATPLLERLASSGGSDTVERQLLTLLASWRDQPLIEQGYGPGNVINLLRLLRGNLCGLDLSRIAIRQAYLQGVDVRDTSLAAATIQDCRFTHNFDAINGIAISSSERYWAAASRRGEIRLWQAGGQVLYHVWQAHTERVWALAFSPDERAVASGSWDTTVKLWDVASATLRWSARHTGNINSVAFAPDGRLLASAGAHDVIIWDVQRGTQRQTLPHPDLVITVDWSPLGHLLATGDVTGRIRFWQIYDTQPAVCLRTLEAHTQLISELAFAPDGTTLASASYDSTVKVWQVASGQLQETLSGHRERVHRVAWSPDGRLLASAGYEPQIWLWDVERRSCRAVLQGHTNGLTDIAFTPDSTRLLSSGDTTVRVWDIATGRCMHVLQGSAAALFDIDWSPDGSQVVSADADAFVSVFTLRGEAPPLVLRGHHGLVFGVAWSPDGQRLASSSWDTTIRLWDPSAGVEVQVLRLPDEPITFFCGLAWSPDGRRLASATYLNVQGVLVWDVTSGAHYWARHTDATPIRRVAWSPDGERLAGGGDNGQVYVWNAADGRLIGQLVGHRGTVKELAWSADGSRLVSAGGSVEGGELFVWDVEGGEPEQRFVGQTAIVYTAAWGASDNLVVSGGSDGKLRWWDLGRGMSVLVRDAHQGAVQSLRRSPDGTKLASCGDDGAIRIWDLRSGEYLQTLRRDRPYERMDITGLMGITEAQRASLIALGAWEKLGDKHPGTDDGAQSIATQSHRADNGQWTRRARNEVIGLPFQPAAFIGRAAELTEIARLLGDPACRLLTLLGPGGIGKTRLALAVAAGHAAAFSDGVAFVALASIGTPSQIVSAIGEALRLSFVEQSDPTAYLLGQLHARHMLLVLDNFEHLLAGVDLVTAILEHAPRISILVTSRERLKVQAEWLFDVDGLAYPPEGPHGSAAPRSLAALTDYSAVQLFVQRARQVQPDLALDEATLTTIVQICQHLAGMPLAIELAAAGVRSLSLSEIERQIRANLDGLTTTLRDVPQRHRSMRAVFDHSWQLLSEGERVLFSRLAVFRGGWTLAAAEHIAGVTLPTLTALVDKSLVRQDSAQPHALAERARPNAAEEPRFAMLEPIREYALEQLAARGEIEAQQRAHANYYLALAEAFAAQWDSPFAETVIKQLDREHDNLRAALRWVCDGGDQTIGLRLAGALRKYWQSRGLISEGRAWLAALLARADMTEDAAGMLARLNATQAAAWLASNQHDFVHATQLFEQSISLQRSLGETAGEPQLLFNAALQARAAGHYQQAIRLLEEAVTQHRARGDRGSVSAGGLGLALYGLGLLFRERGEFARAATLFEECVELHRALGDRGGMAQALLALGDIARDQGNVAEMRRYAEQSLLVFRELGVRWAIGFALNNLALAAALEGELAHAFSLIEESVKLFRSLQADSSLAEVLITQGQIVRAQGENEAAHTALTEALRLAWAVGPRLLVAAALEGLASVVVAQGHAELAVQLLAAASALRVQMGTPVRPIDQASMEHTLAIARSTLGDDVFAAVWAQAKELPLDQLLNTLPSEAAYSSSVAPLDTLRSSSTKRSPAV